MHIFTHTHNTYIKSVSLISAILNFINVYDVYLYDKHPVEGGLPVLGTAI